MTGRDKYLIERKKSYCRKYREYDEIKEKDEKERDEKLRNEKMKAIRERKKKS